MSAHQKIFGTPHRFFGALLIVVSLGVLLFLSGRSRWVNDEIALIRNLINKDYAVRSVSVNVFDGEQDARNPLAFTNIEQPVFPDRVCNIRDYGAVGGGAEKNTTAFEKAIEDCSNHGGGKVAVPVGKWLTGPIHLKSNINLAVEKGAEIVFSADLKDYLPVVFSRFEGVEYYNYSPPIYAADCHDIAITGEGTLNGNAAESWWKLDASTALKTIQSVETVLPVNRRIFGTKSAGLRPAFVQFVNCKNILLSDFTLINSPMWAINPVYSENIIVRGVTVNTEGGGRNNDGIDIDSSRNVLVENSFFDTGDDAIVIKSGSGQDGLRVNKPAENIVIRNTRVLNGHAGFAIGSEISGGVRNVFVYNCNFQDSQYGFRIKTTLVDGGTVENIWVRNIDMKNMLLNAIEIANDYGSDPPDGNYFPPTIKNINVEDVKCDSAKGAIAVRGSERAEINGVSFKDISISSKKSIILKNASDITLENIVIDSKHETDITNVKDLKITNYYCPKVTPKCLKIQGG